MRRQLRHLLSRAAAAALASGLGAWPLLAAAQSAAGYPSRPIRLIIANTTGT